MDDVREALELEEALDAHAPRLADAREVVAAEVDEHHVLGPVLLRRDQGLLAAGQRGARDRVEARASPFTLHERLRGRADQRELAKLEQEKVGRGVDPPKRA